MVQEGPALNKAITTLSKVAGTMSSSPRNIVNAEYDESNVTKLIKDTIGGDCSTCHLLLTLAVFNRWDADSILTMRPN